MGHEMLHFSQDDILLPVRRSGFGKMRATGVWFVRGYSLFLVFKDAATRQKFLERMQHRITLPE
jgi:hypothetical protein